MNNWISVKDKLPQYNLTVLICYGDTRVIDTALLHQSNAGDYWVMNGKYIDIELVTHWQPLPKPPQA